MGNKPKKMLKKDKKTKPQIKMKNFEASSGIVTERKRLSTLRK